LWADGLVPPFFAQMGPSVLDTNVFLKNVGSGIKWESLEELEYHLKVVPSSKSEVLPLRCARQDGDQNGDEEGGGKREGSSSVWSFVRTMAHATHGTLAAPMSRPAHAAPLPAMRSLLCLAVLLSSINTENSRPAARPG
jgi:hypothetical protein